jgi:cob(I)alamin adenosyltransferase
MKIYTRCGDKGYTSLIGGERVAKFDSRVEAYGSVDELISFTALLADKLAEDVRLSNLTEQLRHIESQLMTVSALLAVGEGGQGKVPALNSDATSALEQHIDQMQEQLPAITKFTIPGGDERISLSHICRTVCRRAERAALRAASEHEMDCDAIIYLNRLSDYFYLLGRTVTMRCAVEEIEWIP